MSTQISQPKQLKIQKLRLSSDCFVVAKIILITLLLFVSVPVRVEAHRERYSFEKMNQFENVEQGNYQYLYDFTSLMYSNLSNQISWTNTLVAIVSFVFTVVGIGLAVYVNRIYGKIEKAEQKVKETEAFIKSHDKDLYKQIKREDTMDYINRLLMVPEDVANLGPVFLSRDLLDEDFFNVKDAYLKLDSNDPSYSRYQQDYHLLFFQHFPSQSFQDIQLSEKLIDDLDKKFLNLMFTRDICNFTDAIFMLLKERGFGDKLSKKLLNNFMRAFEQSKFKNNTECIKDVLQKRKIAPRLISDNLDTSSISSAFREQLGL